MKNTKNLKTVLDDDMMVNERHQLQPYELQWTSQKVFYIFQSPLFFAAGPPE